MAEGSGIGSLALKCAAAAAVLMLLPGGVFGEGAPRWGGPGSRDARQFATPAAEAAVRTACASPGAFVVLDTFRFFRAVNMDDDPFDPAHPETARIDHGDLVAAIARLSHPRVTPYQIDPVFNAMTLARDVERLVADIEGGKVERPAAVVSSIVLPVDLDEVNRRLPEAERVARADLAASKARVLDALVGDGGEANPYRMIRDALAALRRLDVPVFVAAGNTAPDALVNMLALAEGAHAVGALDRQGRRAPYASAPEMVAVWAPGQFVVTEADGGLGLNRGAEVLFRNVRMDERKATIAGLVGRDPAEIVKRVPVEIGMLPKRFGPAKRMSMLRRVLEPGLYRTEDLLEAYGYPRTSGNVVHSVGQGAYIHYPSDAIFTLDGQGRLAFDPLGDGGPGQLALHDATSFAAPNICAPSAPATFAARAAELR